MPLDVIREPLLRRLNVYCGISEEDIRAINELSLVVREYREESVVVRDGQRATECCLIAEGFCARSKTLSDGKRRDAQPNCRQTCRF